MCLTALRCLSRADQSNHGSIIQVNAIMDPIMDFIPIRARPLRRAQHSVIFLRAYTWSSDEVVYVLERLIYLNSTQESFPVLSVNQDSWCCYSDSSDPSATSSRPPSRLRARSASYTHLPGLEWTSIGRHSRTRKAPEIVFKIFLGTRRALALAEVAKSSSQHPQEIPLRSL